MRPILFFSILFIVNSSFSQTKAVTENGDEVLLYEDGTWGFTKEIDNEFDSIITNNQKFSKLASLTFALKSKVLPTSIFYNTSKWTMKKAESPSEYTFTHKTQDVYGMFISEQIEIPIENLRKIALENAQEVAPNCEILKEDFRIVNGKKVFFMQMNGTTQGIKFTYLGYYYSNQSGTFQFVTYTAQNLLDKVQADMFELLNGVVIP
jgi:hypothetical protein